MDKSYIHLKVSLIALGDIYYYWKTVLSFGKEDFGKMIYERSLILASYCLIPTCRHGCNKLADGFVVLQN
jgi:hypothetical protein